MVKKLISQARKYIKSKLLLYMLFYLPNKIYRLISNIPYAIRTATLRSVLSRLKYGTVAIHVNHFDAVVEIDIRSVIFERLFIRRSYEVDGLRVIQKYVQADLDVLDVGANIGLFTIYFARKISTSARVLAIEPTPAALSFLSRNIEINDVSRSVIVYNGVVTDKPGEYTIMSIDGREEFSTLSTNMEQLSGRGGFPMELVVHGQTIDNLVSVNGLKPGFIKIDIEGAEFLALQGAKNTLQNFHPVIYSELVDAYLQNFGTSSAQVVEYLRQFGYKVVDVETNLPPIYPFIGNIVAVFNKL